MNPLLFSFLFPSFHGNNGKMHRRYRYPRQEMAMANDPSYGLTDDGDFAILGVNVEETTDNTSDGQIIGSDLLSPAMSETSFSSVLNDNMKIPRDRSTAGVSMDARVAGGGDISLSDAFFGRLLQDNSMVPSHTNGARSKDPKVQSKSGVDVRTAEEDAMSLNDALFGRLPLNTNEGLSNNANNDATNNGGIPKPLGANAVGGTIDEEDEKSLRAWLLEVIPKLNEHDLGAYTRGLSRIGFHPECVTMCELKFEDLDFMKILHRRYLFNEVTGIEHPWEI